MAVRNRAFDSAQYMEFESAWFDLADSEKDAPAESDPEQTGLIAGCPEYIEDVKDYYSHTSRKKKASALSEKMRKFNYNHHVVTHC